MPGNGTVNTERHDIPVDIILPTHGHLELTLQAVKSLYANTQAPFHLIVVDDSEASKRNGNWNRVEASDVTQQFFTALAQEKKNVTYLPQAAPMKCGNQIFNIGTSHCRYDYVATVMNSIRVEPEWETVALQLFENDPKIGTIALKNLLPEGTIESAGIALVDYTPIDIGKGMPGHALTMIRDVPACQWAFALHRKTAIVNLEEEVYNGFVGWDDIDNSFVVKQRGWKIVYCGLGAGYHQPRATRGNDSPEAYNKNHENAHYFYKRWGLWESYTRSKRMDVADRINPQLKQAILNTMIETQVLDHITQEKHQTLKTFTTQVLKELNVSPDHYVLAVDPTRNDWQVQEKQAEPTAKLPEAVPAPPAGDTKAEEKVTA